MGYTSEQSDRSVTFFQVLHVYVDVPGLRDRVCLHPEPGGGGERQPHGAEVAEDAEGTEAAEGDLPLAGNEGATAKSTFFRQLFSGQKAADY